ncbi:hypothetical protein MHYP_G00018990 [Metynnis hypsauchen]
MASKEHKLYDVCTPVIGRGRGLIRTVESTKNKTRVPAFGDPFDLECTTDKEPAEPMSSTPSASNDNTTQQLLELIGELGTQIGDSIVNRLLASQSPVIQTHSLSSQSSGTPRAEPSSTTLDLSRLNVVVKSDVKEPPMFRGDGSDKYNIQEWIEMMETFLHKRGCTSAQQVDEILSHLLGRAKSIVKVGLKSSYTSDADICTETIYDFLKRYFSESPGSCLPLADFYATCPNPKESPVDYWVRLNIAAEAADSHLQKQGSKMENMNSEIAMMFIRNCPDPDLCGVFRCKPISKWTVMDVQEAIDEHQRESHSRKMSHMPSTTRTLKVATASMANSLEIDQEEQRLVSESYGALLEEAKRVGENMVQDAFKISANCQTLSHSSSFEQLQRRSLPSDEVSAILEGQEEWEKGAKERAVSWLVHNVHQLAPLDGPMTGCDSCRINRTASWVAEAIAPSSRPGSQNSLIPENDLSEVDSDTSAIKSQLSCDTGAEDASEKSCDAEGADATHEMLRDVDSVGPVIGEEGVGTIPPSALNPSSSNAVAQIRTRMGRIVKPVNRLIQNMAQKAVHSYDPIRNFTKSPFF